jgi:hypothetical protein
MRKLALGAIAFVPGLAAFAACGEDGAARPNAADASLVDRVRAEAGAGDESADAFGEAASDAPIEPPCADAGASAPQDLRCTGLYASWSAKTLAPGVRAYAPAVPFWSDGAAKERFVYLPPGQTIDTSDMDDWVLPVGTKLWKEFRIGGTRIETRIYFKIAPATWSRTTYLWSSDGETSATRLDTGARNLAGTTYEIPQAIDCDQCHAGKKDQLLGFDAINLGLPGASGVTLAVLAAEGKLSSAPATTALAIPNDVTGVAPPAVGWLHSNCGSCHARYPLAAAFATFMYTRLTVAQLYPDAGAATVKALDVYATTAGVDATQPAYTGLGMKRLAPASADTSLVAHLAGRRDPLDGGASADAAAGQMPPLASHVVDDAGVAALRAWINAMPDGGL